GRREREDRAVARVERDDGAAVRVPAADAVRGARPLDSVLERAFGRALDVQVEGQPDCAARAWVQRRLELAPRVAERVDAQVELPRNAAEVRVVRSLDTRLPDLVARAVRLAELLQLLRRDFARVSEQLR